jgi:hypothetical protein
MQEILQTGQCVGKREPIFPEYDRTSQAKQYEIEASALHSRLGSPEHHTKGRPLVSFMHTPNGLFGVIFNGVISNLHHLPHSD